MVKLWKVIGLSALYGLAGPRRELKPVEEEVGSRR